jgi:osmotically inducible protein OsmC
VTCAASVGPREAGGFGVAVKINIVDHSLPTAEPKKRFVDEAHEKICPYPHAARDNIEIDFSVKGA